MGKNAADSLSNGDHKRLKHVDGASEIVEPPLPFYYGCMSSGDDTIRVPFEGEYVRTMFSLDLEGMTLMTKKATIKSTTIVTEAGQLSFDNRWRISYDQHTTPPRFEARNDTVELTIKAEGDFSFRTHTSESGRGLIYPFNKTRSQILNGPASLSIREITMKSNEFPQTAFEATFPDQIPVTNGVVRALDLNVKPDIRSAGADADCLEGYIPIDLNAGEDDCPNRDFIDNVNKAVGQLPYNVVPEGILGLCRQCNLIQKRTTEVETYICMNWLLPSLGLGISAGHSRVHHKSFKLELQGRVKIRLDSNWRAVIYATTDDRQPILKYVNLRKEEIHIKGTSLVNNLHETFYLGRLQLESYTKEILITSDRCDLHFEALTDLTLKDCPGLMAIPPLSKALPRLK